MNMKFIHAENQYFIIFNLTLINSLQMHALLI